MLGRGVRQSLGDDVVRGHLDALGEPVTYLKVKHGRGSGVWPAMPVRAARRPPRKRTGRANAASELAQFIVGPFGAHDRPLDQPGDVLRSAVSTACRACLSVRIVVTSRCWAPSWRSRSTAPATSRHAVATIRSTRHRQLLHQHPGIRQHRAPPSRCRPRLEHRPRARSRGQRATPSDRTKRLSNRSAPRPARSGRHRRLHRLAIVPTDRSSPEGRRRHSSSAAS